MKYAIIDIGSNTIRLCVSEVEGQNSWELFHNKIVAGLASYVENGVLTVDGIRRACDALRELQQLLSHLEIDQTAVFATASLRNISNTDDAIAAIQRETGLTIDLLSGSEEAAIGYYGVRRSIHAEEGILLDIGGGSTEITYFTADGPHRCRSFSIGSLNLYARCVKEGVLPTKKEQKRMKELIAQVFDEEELNGFAHSEQLCAVGGSARAILRLANRAFALDEENTCLTLDQLKALRKTICRQDRQSIDLILKICPDRVHTVIPGLLILESLAKRLGTGSVEIRGSGIREGYLWHRLLKVE